MTRLALVLVGDELLEGRTVDANGAHLARRCFEAGARLVSARTVGDDEEAIARAVRDAAREADVVVVAGGLGPTEDDRTRHGLARALEVPLVEDDGAWRHVVEALRRRGRESAPTHRRQALTPRGARILPNAEGTAPGIAADLAGKTVLALPGVPREFRAMVESAVLPALAARGGLEPPASAALFTAGLAEADVGAALGDLWTAPDLAVGSYPHEGEIEIRFTARGPGATERVRGALERATSRLGPAAVGPRPLADTVLGLLRERGMRLVVAESMTGGLVGAVLTEVSGASDVVEGGWISYGDAAKSRWLDVPRDVLDREGAVSEAVARAMLDGALAGSAADAAVAVTGSAGPTPAPGPTGVVPAGTVYVGVAIRDGERTVERLDLRDLPRAVVRRRAALAALDRLRRRLLEVPPRR